MGLTTPTFFGIMSYVLSIYGPGIMGVTRRPHRLGIWASKFSGFAGPEHVCFFAVRLVTTRTTALIPGIKYLLHGEKVVLCIDFEPQTSQPLTPTHPKPVRMGTLQSLVIWSPRISSVSSSQTFELWSKLLKRGLYRGHYRGYIGNYNTDY